MAEGSLLDIYPKFGFPVSCTVNKMFAPFYNALCFQSSLIPRSLFDFSGWKQFGLHPKGKKRTLYRPNTTYSGGFSKILCVLYICSLNLSSVLIICYNVSGQIKLTSLESRVVSRLDTIVTNPQLLL